jgi:hypothetical protein
VISFVVQIISMSGASATVIAVDVKSAVGKVLVIVTYPRASTWIVPAEKSTAELHELITTCQNTPLPGKSINGENDGPHDKLDRLLFTPYTSNLVGNV